MIHLGWSGVGNLHRNDPLRLSTWACGRPPRAVARSGVAGLIAWARRPSTKPVQGSHRRASRPRFRRRSMALPSFPRVSLPNAYVRNRGLTFSVWVRVFSTLRSQGLTPAAWCHTLSGALLRGERPKLTAGEQALGLSICRRRRGRGDRSCGPGPQSRGTFNSKFGPSGSAQDDHRDHPRLHRSIATDRRGALPAQVMHPQGHCAARFNRLVTSDRLDRGCLVADDAWVRRAEQKHEQG